MVTVTDINGCQNTDDIIISDAQVSNIQISDVDTTLPNSNTGIVDAINDAYNAATGGSGGVWTRTSPNIYPTTLTDYIGIGTTSPGKALGVVGGVGIMNSTFTSVTERKKDIGVLKAIGAKRKDILIIFLLESGIIGIVGGIIGVIIGFLLAFIVKFIASQAGTSITVVINLNIILIALIFSFVMGVISGFIPAYRASKQQAVDSLREE